MAIFITGLNASLIYAINEGIINGGFWVAITSILTAIGVLIGTQTYQYTMQSKEKLFDRLNLIQPLQKDNIMFLPSVSKLGVENIKAILTELVKLGIIARALFKSFSFEILLQLMSVDFSKISIAKNAYLELKDLDKNEAEEVNLYLKEIFNLKDNKELEERIEEGFDFIPRLQENISNSLFIYKQWKIFLRDGKSYFKNWKS
jgi:hypothetical protein